MKIKRIATIDRPLKGEPVTSLEDVVDLDEALLGFTNPHQVRKELGLGLHQHGVRLIADLRVCVELIPFKK